MSNKEFFGYPSAYPNGYSEFGAQFNDVLPDDQYTYNRIVECPGLHNWFQEIILELVNLSDRTFDGRVNKFRQFLTISCDNGELMKVFQKRKDSYHLRRAAKKLQYK